MKKLVTLSFAFIITILTFGQGVQRVVLFEEFTGENCPPCASVNPYVDALAATRPNEVVLIHYLAPVPTPGILSAQVSALVNGRMNYYGVNSTPWGQEDGFMWDSTLLSNWGNSPITWAADTLTGAVNTYYLDKEYAQPAPFTISITDTLTAATDSFYATVTVTAAESITLPGVLKLQMAMVENLQFATAPGNNGETAWSNAVRAMYPTYSGTTIPSTWVNGHVQSYFFKGKLPSFIRDKTQVRFVAFIQDATSKLVQQTAISNYYNFDLNISTTGIQGGFGTCNSSQYTPVINLTNTGNQTITSCYISEYLDNVFIDSLPWTGSLASAASVNYSLPALNVTQGIHKLTLKITSPNNTITPNPASDSASINLNIPGTEVTTPLIEGFENGDPTITAGWAIENPDHDSTWRLVNVGDGSSHSFMVRYFYSNFYNDFVGPQNNLYAPPINLTYAAHATVKFSYANQWINFGNGYGLDSVYVDVSSDCGNTWTTVLAEGGATAPAQTYGNNMTEFSPSSTAQWKNDTADISVVANHDEVLLRFRTTSIDGNDLYLDNINIYKYDSVPYYAAGIQAISNIQSVSVYPNPANAQLNVSVQLQNNNTVSYMLTDLIGNVVANRSAETGNAGENTFSINTSNLADGTYFVTVSAGNDKVSKLVTITH